MYLDKTEKASILNKTLYCYCIDNQGSLLRRYNPELLSNSERINTTIESYLRKWFADNDQFQKLINKEYYDYENVMRNTFSKDNHIGYLEKLKYNRSILKSEKFQSVFKETNIRINTVFRFAYQLHSYLIIRLCIRIASIIKRDK